MKKYILVLLFSLFPVLALTQTSPPITVGANPVPVYSPGNVSSVTFSQTAGNSVGYTIYTINRQVLKQQAAGSTYTFSPAPAINFSLGQPLGFVSIVTGTATFKAVGIGGGGGGTFSGSVAKGQMVYGENTNVLASNPNMIDCLAYSSVGDLGAAWNACAAAAPAGSTISIAGFSSPQVLTTAVTITNNVTTFCGGLAITQEAAITLSGAGTYLPGTGASLVGSPGNQCTITKNANLDQVTLSDQNNNFAYVTLIGSRAGGFTGNGLVFADGLVFQATAHDFTITGEKGDDILSSSNAQNTIHDFFVEDYGGSGYLGDAAFDFISKGYFSDAGDATGGALDSTAGSFTIASNLNIGTSSIVAAVSCQASNLSITTSNIFNSGGGSAIGDGSSGCLVPQIVGNWQIDGGGAHGPMIDLSHSASGNNTLISNNVEMLASAGDDGIKMMAGQGAQITNNSALELKVGGQTGKCAIRITSGIGGIIKNNGLTITGGATATGHNFTLCVDTATSLHTNTMLVKDNLLTGQGQANDFGIIFDNTAAVAGSFVSGNIFESNVCVDMNTCISRVDSTNQGANNYINNQPLATTNFFDGGGSTNDIVIQNVTGNTFAFTGLPIAGKNSQVTVNDSTTAIWGATIIGSGSNTVLAFNDGTNWTVMGK